MLLLSQAALSPSSSPPLQELGAQGAANRGRACHASVQPCVCMHRGASSVVPGLCHALVCACVCVRLSVCRYALPCPSFLRPRRLGCSRLPSPCARASALRRAAPGLPGTQPFPDTLPLQAPRAILSPASTHVNTAPLLHSRLLNQSWPSWQERLWVRMGGSWVGWAGVSWVGVLSAVVRGLS